MSGRPGGLAMPCATSMRKPSTPRSSQNRSVFSRSSNTSGLSQFRSGCSASNRCRYHWPGLPSGSTTRVQARPAEDRQPVVRRMKSAGPGAVAEDVALPLHAARAGGQRGLKPRMLGAGVVGHQIHGDLDAPGVRGLDEPVQRVDAAEQRVDVARVRHVVAVIGHRRDDHRVEPDGVDAQQLEVVELGR